jgi:phosphatidylglycerophosphate synthase
MLQTLKEIKKIQKRPDGIFGSFMTRPVSHIFAFISYKLSLTPNFVSFLSLLFCLTGLLILYFNTDDYYLILLSSVLWWIGAILDAADGDLARYSGQGSQFGGWFDSFLDRIKEFMVFGLLGYLTFKKYNEDIYLLAGFLSILSNVMSGYISDTKKLFITERTPEIRISKNYSFGMADTRDFFIIISLILDEFRIALGVYSTVFLVSLMIQTYRFTKKYR